MKTRGINAVSVMVLPVLVLAGCGDAAINDKDVSVKDKYSAVSNEFIQSELAKMSKDSVDAATEIATVAEADAALSGDIEITGGATPLAATAPAVEAATKDHFEEIAEDLLEGDEEVQNLIIADYDRDGALEAFCYIKDPANSDEMGDYGRVAYISADDEVETFDEMWASEIKFVDFSGQSYYVVSESFVTSIMDHVYGIKKGAPAEMLPGIGQMIPLEDTDDFVMICDAYDILSDGTGHSWKPYYFTWYDGAFYEYGGLMITRDELSRLKGGKAILDELMATGRDIDSIYYRANGIINVNLTLEGEEYEEYSNCILAYDNGTVEYIYDDLESSMEDGYYLAAISDLALYPNKLGDTDHFADNTVADDVFTHKSRFGVTVEISEEYAGMIEIDTSDSGLASFETYYYKGGGWEGGDALIAYVCRMPREDFDNEAADAWFDGTRIYVEEDDDGYVIFAGGPTDVQWDYQNEEITANYRMLEKVVWAALDEAFGYDK